VHRVADRPWLVGVMQRPARRHLAGPGRVYLVRSTGVVSWLTPSERVTECCRNIPSGTRSVQGHGKTNAARAKLVCTASVSGIYFRSQTLPGSAISRREQLQQHACAEAGLTRSPRRRATETNPGWSGRWPWRWSDRLRPGGDHPDVATTLIARQICGRLTRFLESQSEPLEACYRLG
jgi:hypothetical protein